MGSNVVYLQGRAEITVPATESIAVFTKDKVSVFRELGYPNVTTKSSKLAEVSNAEQVFGAYADGATIILEAKAAKVLYQVGASPVVLENLNRQSQGAPTAETVAATLTIAELLTGIITGTHTVGGTAAYTLPTGTLCDAGLEMDIGESFDWSLINLSAAAADTITVTAGTGHTVVGNMIVQSVHATTGLIYGSSGRFRTRKTAANTFITYRIA